MIEELNIAFIGVGGTGVITAAQIIAEAALKEGYNAVQGEIHGLAQRGGSVLSVSYTHLTLPTKA